MKAGEFFMSVLILQTDRMCQFVPAASTVLEEQLDVMIAQQVTSALRKM